MSKQNAAFGVAVAALSLQGCGVTIEATRIDPKTAHEQEGVVYSLPRTELSLVLPVTLTTKSGGALSGSWTECLRTCREKPLDIGKEKACSYDTRSAIRFGVPEILGASTADPAHMYRVVVTPGYFDTVSHKFVVGENGVLSESQTTASNATYEIVSSTLGTLIGLDALKIREVKLAERMSQEQRKNVDCRALEKTIDDKVSGKSGELSCLEATQVSQCLSAAEGAVKAAKRKRADEVEKALKDRRDADTIKLIDQQGREAIGAAEAEAAAERARFSILELTTTRIPYIYQTYLGYPTEFQPMEVKPFDLKERLDSGGDGPTATISSTHDAGERERGTLTELLKGYMFQANVNPAVDLSQCRSAGSPCSGPIVGGYRYRIPAKAVVTSVVKKGGSEIFKTKATMSIAQYGVVATMPSKFKGKGGKVSVKLHPAMGTLDTAELNAEALPTTVITDQIDKVKAQVEARRTADPELATLEREAKIAELRKKIREANSPDPAK